LRKRGSLTRVDHVYALKPNSNSLYHINIKVNQVKARGSGGFPVPHDVELLKFVALARCLDSTEIMLGKSMEIIHYWKVAMVENA